MNLGGLRVAVQFVSFLLLVWGSHVVGYYMAEKISHALPALACAYNTQTGAYCVLVPFQHQIHHRLGGGLASGMLTMEMLLPTLLTFTSFFVLFVVLNKAFCGWVCPMGTIQALLASLGRRISLPLIRVKDAGLAWLRPWKWALLAGFVVLLPLLAGLGVTPAATGNAFCQICPSRQASTLLGGSAEHVAVPTGVGTASVVPVSTQDAWLDMGFVVLRNGLFGFIIIASLRVRQPFCRVCPMLALHALLRRLALLRLVKASNERCRRCGICTKACPMDIPEISRHHGAKAFHADCILCGRCAEFCPDRGIIKLKWGPFPLFSSSPEYFKKSIKREKPDGRRK